VYGTVCTVVWEGGAVRFLPIPIPGFFRRTVMFHKLARAVNNSANSREAPDGRNDEQLI